MSFTAIPEKTPVPRRLLFRLRIAPDYKQSILFRCGNISLDYRKRGDFSSLNYSFGSVSHNLIAVYQ